jgi:hypothetical protein
MRLKKKPSVALPQPWSPVIHSRTKAPMARNSASAAIDMATISMIEKSALEMSRSRCRKTGIMASGSARLPKRRAQMAHFEVRMRMRIRSVTA